MMTRDSQAKSFPFAFPPTEGSPEAPVWTGRGFRTGDRETPILSYAVGQSGWTDDLTTFHQETSGEDHFIDRASQRHTLAQLQRWLTTASPVIIDIGCTSGLVLRALRREYPNGTVMGADYVGGQLEKLAQGMDDVPLLQFDLTNCPLPDQSVDGIVLLNVLEHIERDEAALAHVARILKPNGVAVIEVPAGRRLYDVYDKLLLHHRRYSMRGLVDKVSAAGLQVLEKSHLGFFLYPPFWAVKKRNKRYLKESPETQKLVVSQAIRTAKSYPLLHGVMKLEAGLRTVVPYPFGIRCLLTCRRPA